MKVIGFMKMLCCNMDQVVPFEKPIAYIDSAVVTDPNLKMMAMRRTNPEMEDYAHEGKNCFGTGQSFFGIYDGHGGSSVAKYCSTRMQQIFNQKFQEHTATFDFTKVWTDTYTTLDAELSQNVDGTDADCEGCAAANLFVFQQDNQWGISAANVGDASCLLCDATTLETKWLTKHHRPIEDDEANRVRAAGGKITGEGIKKRLNGRLALTRTLGDHFMKKTTKGLISTPHVYSETHFPTFAKPVIVLASDGLWDVVSIDDVRPILSRHASAQDMAQDLLKLALKNNSADNISIIVVKLFR